MALPDFCAPDLSGFCMDAVEREFAHRFTRIRPIAVCDEPDAHASFLIVGGQQFRISGYGSTAQEASWTCLQLAKAIRAAAG